MYLVIVDTCMEIRNLEFGGNPSSTADAVAPIPSKSSDEVQGGYTLKDKDIPPGLKHLRDVGTYVGRLNLDFGRYLTMGKPAIY